MNFCPSSMIVLNIWHFESMISEKGNTILIIYTYILFIHPGSAETMNLY